MLREKFSQTAVEDRCSTKSEAERLGPVRNQGATPWCFAYTAADLLTHELKLGPKNQVSALWTGAMAKAMTGEEISNLYIHKLAEKKDISSLMMMAAIMALREARDHEGKWANPYNLTPAEYLALTQGLSSAKDQRAQSLLDGVGGIVENSLEVAIAQSKFCSVEDLKAFENQDLEPIAALSVIRHRAEKRVTACDSRRKLDQDIVALGAKMIDEQKKIIANSCSQKMTAIKKAVVINESIQDGSMPMTPEKKSASLYRINQLLNDGKIVGMSYRARAITAGDPGIHDMHASSVIGRRVIGGKCFYQVRNSWGPSCDHYKKNDPQVVCENGGSILVEEEHLMKHLVSIQYFKKSP